MGHRRLPIRTSRPPLLRRRNRRPVEPDRWLAGWRSSTHQPKSTDCLKCCTATDRSGCRPECRPSPGPLRQRAIDCHSHRPSPQLPDGRRACWWMPRRPVCRRYRSGSTLFVLPPETKVHVVPSNFHKSLRYPRAPTLSYPEPPKSQKFPEASVQVTALVREPGFKVPPVYTPAWSTPVGLTCDQVPSVVV